MKNQKYTVTMILPKDKKSLEKKYAETLAEIISNKLSHEELGCLISELEKKMNIKI